LTRGRALTNIGFLLSMSRTRHVTRTSTTPRTAGRISIRLLPWLGVALLLGVWALAVYERERPAIRRLLTRLGFAPAPPPIATGPAENPDVARLMESLQRRPEDVAIRNELADTLINLGRATEAIPYLQAAIDGGTTNAHVYLHFGTAQNSRGLYEEALAPLRRAMELAPSLVEAHMGIAGALRNLNRPYEAIESYRRVVEIDPDHELAYRFLAFLLANMGLQEEAVEAYREVIRLQPEDAETLTNMGILLNRLARRDEAVAALKQAVALRPQNVQVRYALGYTYEQDNRFGEAIEQYQKVLELSPNHQNASTRLTTALNRQEQQLLQQARAAERVGNEPDVETNDDDPEQGVRLNFEAAPLERVLRFFSMVSGRSYEADDGLTMNITLRRDERLSLEEALRLLEQKLAEQRVALTPAGENVVRVHYAETE